MKVYRWYNILRRLEQFKSEYKEEMAIFTDIVNIFETTYNEIEVIERKYNDTIQRIQNFDFLTMSTDDIIELGIEKLMLELKSKHESFRTHLLKILEMMRLYMNTGHLMML
jgi:wyosine [tRNA(Phe)-imidazoG37] synthetase (radical SAM superfamily)